MKTEEKHHDTDLDYVDVHYEETKVSLLTEVDGEQVVIDTNLSEDDFAGKIREGLNLYAKDKDLLSVLEPLKEDYIHMLSENFLEVLELRAKWHMSTDLSIKETWEQSFGLALDWTNAEMEDKFGVDMR